MACPRGLADVSRAGRARFPRGRLLAMARRGTVQACARWGCHHPGAWDKSRAARPPREDAHVEDRPSPAAWRPRRPGRAAGPGAGPGHAARCHAAAATAPGTGANDLRLGALFPFSGGLALLGDESYRGLELAAEERNAAGGLLARPIRLVKGDAADAGRRSPSCAGWCRRRRSAPPSAPASHLPFAATQVAELQGLPYFEIGRHRRPDHRTRLPQRVPALPAGQRLRPRFRGHHPGGAGRRLVHPGRGAAIAILHEDGLYGQTVGGFQEAQLRARGLNQVEKLGYSARSVDSRRCCSG